MCHGHSVVWALFHHKSVFFMQSCTFTNLTGNIQSVCCFSKDLCTIARVCVCVWECEGELLALTLDSTTPDQVRCYPVEPDSSHFTICSSCGFLCVKPTLDCTVKARVDKATCPEEIKLHLISHLLCVVLFFSCLSLDQAISSSRDTRSPSVYYSFPFSFCSGGKGLFNVFSPSLPPSALLPIYKRNIILHHLIQGN